jgi:hypothetical protein
VSFKVVIEVWFLVFMQALQGIAMGDRGFVLIDSGIPADRDAL